ncbi:MAG: ISAzo13 family transposase, partial [Methanophagales archaeon]|nr:ISAzo13 family transposase [Methanophagales archaeon]
MAGIKALEFGWSGISKVGRLTGKDYKTIKKGITEVENGKFLDKNEKLRKKGAGR